MKRRSTIVISSLVLACIIVVNACSKKDKGSTSFTTPMKLAIPSGWPEPHYNFSNNELTEQGFALGRKLFYDGRLSKDGNFPCASCHQQFAAFATFDHDLSHGFNNQFTTRNSPGLFNLAWHKELHWDGGINHIEVQPLAPITAPNEMAEDINNVIEKLNGDQEYKTMFRAAFGDETVNSQRMLKALAQFMGAMVSANSKYDKVMRKETQFSEPEQKGYELFKAKCASCHKEPLFTDLSFRNNGLPLNNSLNDIGRMAITNSASDSLLFKVPSLRNMMLTFPYMHDGRFKSPLQVLDHYTDGIHEGPTVDPLLKNKIPITYQEKFYFLEFFKTLTDTSFVNDKRFSQPD
jgi:cytochrome c peroxidase